MKKHFIIAFFIGWGLYAAYQDSYHHNFFIGIGMALASPGVLLAMVLPNAPQFLTIYGGSAVFWILLGASKSRRTHTIAVSPASPTVTRTAWRRRTRTFTEK